VRVPRPLLGALLVAGVTTPGVDAQATALTTELVATGLPRPVFATSPPGDEQRLFFLEQDTADIHILHLDTGQVQANPFLDLSAIVSVPGTERGLLGLAFHPDYDDNGWFFVNYTSLDGGSTRLARYTVSGNPNVADETSGVTVLQITQPQNNHNGGMLDFGPDGMLWMGTGDGGNFDDSGSGHAAGGNSQSGTTLLGKMLRLDVDQLPYAVPPDNPFVGDPLVLDEIWAVGLRNPWRHSFDRVTGDLWIGDVGQNIREEVDIVPRRDVAAVAAGLDPALNFGWRCEEGLLCTGLTGCTCGDAGHWPPLLDYDHGIDGQAVIGGHVYRGRAIPDLAGAYLYADHTSHRIWSLRQEDGAIVPGTHVERSAELAPSEGTGLFFITSFGQDGAGELYLCTILGDMYKLVPAGPFVGVGGALAGVAGEPAHFGTGGVAAGEPGALHLRGGAPLATTGLLLGLAEGAVAFKGGVLKPVPVVDVVVMTTDVEGAIDLAWSDTGGAPPGTLLVTQFALVDGVAPKGVALSNGLRTTWP
jgi:hypothetical protein